MQRINIGHTLASMVLAAGLAIFTVGNTQAEGDGPGGLPPGHPPIGASAAAKSMGAQGSSVTGEIIETMDTGNYTYLKVRGADKTIWAAAERFPAKLGERVTIPGNMIMKNFESPTLGRTFEELYFADSVLREGEDQPALPAGHPVVPAAPVAAGTPPEIIAQPEGGLSVADIYSRRVELSGQEIKVKGRVASFTERVMGRNWIHLSDGTGSGKEAELVVNTPEATRVGALITVQGRLYLDQDLGHGYRYPVLIKDAVLSEQ